MRGVAVVDVLGRLDIAVVQPCRAALDAAMTLGRPVVVNLDRATSSGRDSVALLGAMRRYLGRRRAAMIVAAVPVPLLAALERQQVEDLYEIVPTVAQGIERREGCSLAGRRRGELEVIPPGGRQLVTAP